ncbi:MAG: hypothetical protein ACLQLH_15385 [Terracidiphilus sp.]
MQPPDGKYSSAFGIPIDEREPQLVAALKKLTLPDSGKAKWSQENRSKGPGKAVVS